MSELKRLPGWRARLSALVDSYRLSQIEYGAFDCAVFSAGGVEALTGAQIGKRAWWKYRTAEGGLKTMRSAGFTNLADMAASVLPEIHPSQAYVGDVAAIEMDSPFGFALGIVIGERIMFPTEGRSGLGSLDLLSATRAFKVG